MARNTGLIWMEHEEHGVMPVYDPETKKLNESNGWKVCKGPHGSPAMQKKWKADTQAELDNEPEPENALG